MILGWASSRECNAFISLSLLYARCHAIQIESKSPSQCNPYYYVCIHVQTCNVTSLVFLSWIYEYIYKHSIVDDVFLHVGIGKQFRTTLGQLHLGNEILTLSTRIEWSFHHLHSSAECTVFTFPMWRSNIKSILVAYLPQETSCLLWKSIKIGLSWQHMNIMLIAQYVVILSCPLLILYAATLAKHFFVRIV